MTKSKEFKREYVLLDGVWLKKENLMAIGNIQKKGRKHIFTLYCIGNNWVADYKTKEQAEAERNRILREMGVK